MVNPYNGPAAKLLTPPTLNLVKMTITGHHMVIQSLLNIVQVLMLILAQVENFFNPHLLILLVPVPQKSPLFGDC